MIIPVVAHHRMLLNPLILCCRWNEMLCFYRAKHLTRTSQLGSMGVQPAGELIIKIRGRLHYKAPASGGPVAGWQKGVSLRTHRHPVTSVCPTVTHSTKSLTLSNSTSLCRHATDWFLGYLTALFQEQMLHSVQWEWLGKSLERSDLVYLKVSSRYSPDDWFILGLFYTFTNAQSGGSSVSVVTELRAGQPGFDSRQGQGFFFLRHHDQTDFGAHPASCQRGTGGSSPFIWNRD
jgi:hypothetical protein